MFRSTWKSISTKILWTRQETKEDIMKASDQVKKEKVVATLANHLEESKFKQEVTKNED